MQKQDLTPKQHLFWNRCYELCLSFLDYLFIDEFRDEDFGYVTYDTGNATAIGFKIRKLLLDATHFPKIVDFMKNTSINIQIEENCAGVSMLFWISTNAIKSAAFMTDEAIKGMYQQEIETYKKEVR